MVKNKMIIKLIFVRNGAFKVIKKSGLNTNGITLI